MNKSKIHFKIITLAILISVFSSACAHSVRINTEPEGANVHVNGVFLGESPVILRERSGLPKNYYIKIDKKGYKAVDTTIEQNYKADITLLWLLPGIIPYFFTSTLENDYDFSLLSKK